MTGFIIDELNRRGLRPTGPPVWDEKRELWTIPVEKIPDDQATTWEVKFEWHPNICEPCEAMQLRRFEK